MTVLLLILKILGIILLVIVGLVLLLILLLLFVPFRYQLEGRYQDKLKARADVGWLLKLIHVRAEAINLQIRVKILALGHCFKKMYLGQWDDQKPEDFSPDDGTEKDMEKDEPSSSGELKPQAPEEKARTEEKPFDSAVRQEEEQEEKKKEKKKRNKKEKARQAAQKAREKYERVFESLEREQEKSALVEAEYAEESETEMAEETDASFTEKLQDYSIKAAEFWDNDRNQKAVMLILRELQKVGKHLLPTAFILDGELGLKDPAQTGRIVGWVWRLYPFYGEHIRLNGLYDQEKVNVYMKVKGRLRIGFFVGVALRLYMNPKIREWIRYFRNKDKGAEETAPESKENSGKKAA